jgi:hypothetical protein
MAKWFKKAVKRQNNPENSKSDSRQKYPEKLILDLRLGPLIGR